MSKRMMNRLGTTLFLLGALGVGETANAHGRYPVAGQLATEPNNPQKLWLRATYGLLASRDAGANWDWVCQDAVGYGEHEDPKLAVASDGKLFAASADGLLVTHDGGCTWATNADIGRHKVVDVTLDAEQKRLLALVEVGGDDGYALTLYRSDPPFEHFEMLGSALSSDLLGSSLAVAPSDPTRLYISGAYYGSTTNVLSDAPGYLLRSRNGGGTWERLAIPGASLSQTGFVAAVNPTNPDDLYVRILGAAPESGPVSGTLLRSEDAGDTWRQAFSGPADITGVALSSDGKRIALGLGTYGERQVDLAALGLYRASASDLGFEHGLAGQVGCLTASGTSLFACGSHASNGFELGVSTDEGTSIAPLLDIGGVRGPLSCPNDTAVHQLCEAEWAHVCDEIGNCSEQIHEAPVDNHLAEVPPEQPDAGGCSVSSARGLERHSNSSLALVSLLALGFACRRTAARTYRG